MGERLSGYVHVMGERLSSFGWGVTASFRASDTSGNPNSSAQDVYYDSQEPHTAGDPVVVSSMHDDGVMNQHAAQSGGGLGGGGVQYYYSEPNMSTVDRGGAGLHEDNHAIDVEPRGDVSAVSSIEMRESSNAFVTTLATSSSMLSMQLDQHLQLEDEGVPEELYRSSQQRATITGSVTSSNVLQQQLQQQQQPPPDSPHSGASPFAFPPDPPYDDDANDEQFAPRSSQQRTTITGSVTMQQDMVSPAAASPSPGRGVETQSTFNIHDAPSPRRGVGAPQHHHAPAPHETSGSYISRDHHSHNQGNDDEFDDRDHTAPGGLNDDSNFDEDGTPIISSSSHVVI